MTERANVPCKGCFACCKGQIIAMVDDDDASLYKTETLSAPGVGEITILQHKDGVCVHLVEGRCEVWDHAPKICRLYDCRAQFVSLTRNQRRTQMEPAIRRAARKLLGYS